MFGVFKKLLQEAVIRNLGLEQLVHKLKIIVLSSTPLAEIPTRLNDTFEMFRRSTRGTITTTEIEDFVSRIGDRDPWEDARVMWEPLSDSHGEEITPNGWQVKATLYLLNGQPWWLADAKRDPHSPPTPEDDAVLDDIMNQLGADTRRDLVRDMRDLPELGYLRIWTVPHRTVARNASQRHHWSVLSGSGRNTAEGRLPARAQTHLEGHRRAALVQVMLVCAFAEARDCAVRRYKYPCSTSSTVSS